MSTEANFGASYAPSERARLIGQMAAIIYAQRSVQPLNDSIASNMSAKAQMYRTSARDAMKLLMDVADLCEEGPSNA